MKPATPATSVASVRHLPNVHRASFRRSHPRHPLASTPPPGLRATSIEDRHRAQHGRHIDGIIALRAKAMRYLHLHRTLPDGHAMKAHCGTLASLTLAAMAASVAQLPPTVQAWLGDKLSIASGVRHG